AAWPPLGVRRVVEPQFYHATPDTGQVLVMASPALDRVASPRAIAEAIADGGETAQRRLLALAAGQDVRALIVTLAAREPGAAGRDDERPAAARDERPAPQPMPATAARRSQGPGERPQPRRRSPSQVLGLLRRVLPERPGGAARPQRRPAAATSPAPQRQATRLVVALAILLPLLVLALVAGVRYQYEHNQRQRVAELVRQAGEARTAAANTPDAAAQRVSLRQAIGLLDQALAIAPGEPQVSTLREQVLAALDAASGVRRLYTLWELADLPAGADGQAQVARLLPRDLDLFILDRGADRAYGRQLNPAGDALAPVEGSAVLVQKGDSRAGTAVGELIDLLWMPAGGERREPGLVFLDRNGSLLEWRPAQGLAVLPVANSSTWRKPAAAGGYGGNLYLLDPQLNRILKYVPSATGYTAPPVDYIADPGSVDLSGAVDMAIDGYIYVLMADGTVLKYLSGRPVTFNISGLDEPLRNPVAIYASGDDEAHGFLYVADAGLARVVQLSKQGQFIRQFKAAEGQGQLADLSGLSVDEAKQRLYLGSGGKVYMAPLSAEAPTPVPTQTAS
ncbi:MAG TPA: hypothetical protein PLB78_03315, partial [Anaerolineae bacterium]|nr:hypothetical protein [Anaerolineae bacterium]